jgi:chemotaxis protein MotB
MARKRHQEDNHNYERWVVSYADFITLLFAFFVVMYSISSVNEGKYKVLTDSFEAVFSNTLKQKLPISINEYDANNIGSADRILSLPLMSDDISHDNDQPLVLVSAEPLPTSVVEATPMPDLPMPTIVPPHNNLNNIASQLQQNFSALIEEDLLSIKSNDQWIEVDIKSSILFASGQASLNVEAQAVIEKIASVLAGYENAIQVEGFTDNVPIETSQYPSNWELSSARAAAIVRLMVESSIKPERLAAVGYGEFQPIADNETELGRKKNRRVVLVISKDALMRNSL